MTLFLMVMHIGNHWMWRQPIYMNGKLNQPMSRIPPYFTGMTMQPDAIAPIQDACCLALLGDSITTDHISPAGSIQADSPAGRYLISHGVEQKRF